MVVQKKPQVTRTLNAKTRSSNKKRGGTSNKPTYDEKLHDACYGNAGPSTVKEQRDMKDMDIYRAISALDTLHDFAKPRNGKTQLDRVLVIGIIRSFLNKKQCEIFDKYSRTNNNHEEKLYENYVTNNSNIDILCKLQLNTQVTYSTTGGGRTQRTADDKNKKTASMLPVLNRIAKYYNIQEDSIVIVKDDGVACLKDLLHVDSYAAWFDTNNLSVCKDNANNKDNFKLEVEASISKTTNDLFYIDRISGNYINNSYSGLIEFGSKTPEKFSQDNQTNNKADMSVPTITNWINSLNENNKKPYEKGQDWFSEQIKYIYKSDGENATNNACMFLMDLKRAGDALQIASCSKVPNNKIPIFMTMDRIAATIAVNKGILTILTTQKNAPRGTNLSSIGYAILLKPASGLSGNTNNIAPAPAPMPMPMPAPAPMPAPKKPEATKVEVNTKPLDTAIERRNALIKELLSDPSYTRKKLIIGSLKTRSDEIKSIQGKIEKSISSSDFTDTQTAYIKTHIQKFTLIIQRYIETVDNPPTNIMKEYLNFIIKLTNKYITDKNFDALFYNLYIDIYNIYIIILNNRADFNDTTKKFVVGLTSVSKDNFHFIINYIIAKYVENIFNNYDYEDEYGIIDNLSETKQNTFMNKVVMSPITTIYIEYLLSKTQYTTEMIAKLRGDIIKISPTYVSQGDSEILIMITDTKISEKKVPTVILTFLKNATNSEQITHIDIAVNPREDLKNLYNRIYNEHIKFMNNKIPLSNDITGGNGVKRNRESSEVYIGSNSKVIQDIKNSYINYKYKSHSDELCNFMKLPFEVKHMIIQYSSDKEKIIKDVFTKFYKDTSIILDEKEIETELRNIRYCKHVLNIELEKPIQRSTVRNNNAFLLFRESLYFYPEYIDPVMCIYMTYTNSFLPPMITMPISIKKLTEVSSPETPVGSKQSPSPKKGRNTTTATARRKLIH
jgi:hypothetical protein